MRMRSCLANRGLILVVLLVALAGTRSARAQAAQTNVELRFTPTDRVQLAVWIERDDGLFMGTLALTHGVAMAGIGNRPGALQMNSGFRWPYGRREGVLPVWAHRRASAPGARQFKRVIFQNRQSEGYASRTSSDQSVDDYYCLSFNKESTGRDALDAVTCASVFSSDKGRFINEGDVAAGYAEPYQNEQGTGDQRKLSLTSLYPPRRDVTRCTASGCFDHPDVANFAQHAREVMPEIDAVSRATPQGERPVSWTFGIPQDWSTDHEYTLYIEANVEGDYNERWGAQRFPTPMQPIKGWDSWAQTFGYPYRGQPSIVYALPFSLDATELVTAVVPAGFGALEGENGELHTMDGSITNDAVQAKGSGADRLRSVDGVRASLRVTSTDPCSRPNPPAMCGRACGDGCGSLVCDQISGTCKGFCAATSPPSAVYDLRMTPYPDELRAHMWARLSFRTGSSERPVGAYEVKLKSANGDWTPAFTRDATHELLPVALDVCSDPTQPNVNRCTDMKEGTLIEVDLTGLTQSTAYTVAVTPRDATCGEAGPETTTSFTTPTRTFTTVSPCFIATATYGSPLASEVSVLRRVRDRYLASHAPGRWLIATYYRIGPEAAALVREHDWLRWLSRAVIAPLVAVSRWWSE